MKIVNLTMLIMTTIVEMWTNQSQFVIATRQTTTVTFVRSRTRKERKEEMTQHDTSILLPKRHQQLSGEVEMSYEQLINAKFLIDNPRPSQQRQLPSIVTSDLSESRHFGGDEELTDSVTPGRKKKSIKTHF
jgi:DNA primase large subunit